MSSAVRVSRICLVLALLGVTAAALAQTPSMPPPPAAPAAPQAPTEPVADPTPAATTPPPSAAEPAKETPLPAGHELNLQLKVDPPNGVHTGDVVHLQISAQAALGDDVTIGEQSFAPFEINKKRARVEPASGNKQTFVFDLDLLALEPGQLHVPTIKLRVVTKDGFVGSASTQTLPYTVRSWLGNEPNAQPKPETKPVVVMQDNWWPIYIAGGLLAIALIAGLTLLVSRYLRNRKRAAAPPPPRRPPWEIAIEKLGELRRVKQQMLQDGFGARFIDQVSDVLREYLGARYAFDGLETTSDEMIGLLKERGVGVTLTQETALFLNRCDLIKFAKVEPDQQEADELFDTAGQLVEFGRPVLQPAGGAPATPPQPLAAEGTLAAIAPRSSARPAPPAPTSTSQPAKPRNPPRDDNDQGGGPTS